MSYGSVESGRIPNAEHESQPWRIHEVVPDFTLEDVWALPVEGGAGEFPAYLELAGALDPSEADSRATRSLWKLRDLLGKWFGLGEIHVEDGSGAATDALYRTEREAAAEVSNRTVHGVAHFAWVDQGDGRYRGQMAVYVKPRGLLGHAYMAAIKPFRYLIIKDSGGERKLGNPSRPARGRESRPGRRTSRGSVSRRFSVL